MAIKGEEYKKWQKKMVDRKKKMFDLHEKGLTYEEIGIKYGGISKQVVYQHIKDYKASLEKDIHSKPLDKV